MDDLGGDRGPEDIVNSPAQVKKDHHLRAGQVKNKYALPRRTEIVYEHQLETVEPEDETPGLSGQRLPLPGGLL